MNARKVRETLELYFEIYFDLNLLRMTRVLVAMAVSDSPIKIVNVLSIWESVKTSETYHRAFPYFCFSVDLKASKFSSQITKCDFFLSYLCVAASPSPCHQRYLPVKMFIISNEDTH